MTVESDPVPLSIDEVEVQFQDGQGGHPSSSSTIG